MTANRHYHFSSLLTSALCLLLLLSFLMSLLGNTLRTRDYLQQQIVKQGQEASTFLGLYLSSYMDEAQGRQTMVEMTINALFNSGYYDAISVIDRHGTLIFEKRMEQLPDDVPRWFTQLLPLSHPAIEAPISRGWVDSGTVVIEISPVIAYQYLWQQVQGFSIHYLLLSVAGTMLAWVLTRRTARTLTRLTNQAKAMTLRQFPAQPLPLPQTRIQELQWLIDAFHLLQQWLQRQLQLHDQVLGDLEQHLFVDPLTGLANRRALERDFRVHSGEEARHFQGEGLLIRAPLLDEINQHRGFPQGNDYLLAINHQLTRWFSNEQLYRLSGREWLILSKAHRFHQREQLYTQLTKAIAQLEERYEHAHPLTTQYIYIDQGCLLNTVLALLDQQPENAPWDPIPPITEKSGRAARRHALQNLLKEPVTFNIQPIVWQDQVPWFAITAHFDTELQLETEDLFKQARLTGLGRALDTHVLSNTFRQLRFLNSPDAIFVLRLSHGPLTALSFFEIFIGLQKNHGFPCQQIVLAIDADHTVNDTVTRNISRLKKAGIRILVMGAGDNLISLTQVLALAPDVMKFSSAVIRPVLCNNDTAHYRLIELLVKWAHSLDIGVVLDHLETEQDLKLADSLQVEGRQGYLLNKPVQLNQLLNTRDNSRRTSAATLFKLLQNAAE